MNTALETIHGSKLYGLSHSNSDHDTYAVLSDASKRYARQSIKGKDDIMLISLHRFLSLCDEGVPQALEALFSPYAKMDPRYAPMFRAFRIGATQMSIRYRRTILNFGFQAQEKNADGERIPADTLKLRRHALRLCYNLSDGLRYGRFNPAFTPEQAAELTRLATPDDDEYTETLIHSLEQALLGKLTF